ncbi:MAG: four helix bundle protein [Candidatus Ratteibacteria bacterium]|jgi:four helix bundle protein
MEKDKTNEAVRPHKKLEVWQKSIELTEIIYKITSLFPKEEIYGLTNQMRRCAVSVASNIAEGAARNSTKEFLQFLSISQGSLSELDTQLEISLKLNYLNERNYKDTVSLTTTTFKLISGLVRKLKTAV